MNLEAVLSAVSQTTAPQTPGATASQQNTDGNGNFNQILTTMVQHANQPQTAPPLNGITAQGDQVDWLNMLMNIFGQETDTGMLTLDPTGEASLPSTDAAVSLTEVMAALQTMTTQENLLDLTSAAATNITAEQLETLLNEKNQDTDLDIDTINALLAIIGAPAADTSTPVSLPQLLQQLQAVTNVEQASPQVGPSLLTTAPSSNTAIPTATTSTAADTSTPATITNTEQITAFQNVQSQNNLSSEITNTPPPTTAELASQSDTTTPSVTMPTNTNGNSANLSHPVSPNLSQPETTNTPTNSAPLSDTAISQPTTSPIAPAFIVPESTSAAPTATTLPDIPALHQIVKSIELISHNDKQAVRLQLYPESLGQILVHLDTTSDGTVTVRMLAETMQAQNLVQDHLPQLKQALASQGLQADTLSVAVGSDASAFDAPDNPARRGFQGTPQRNFAPNLNRGEHPSSVSSISRSGSSLHTVDYQV